MYECMCGNTHTHTHTLLGTLGMVSEKHLGLSDLSCLSWPGGLLAALPSDTKPQKCSWQQDRGWGGVDGTAHEMLGMLRIKDSPSLIAQLVKNPLQCRRPWFDSWVGKIHWRRERLPIPVLLGFPCGSAGKESACNVGDLGSIPRLGRSPGEGKGYPLQYSGLENSMDSALHGVTKSWTWLSDFHSLSQWFAKGSVLFSAPRTIVPRNTVCRLGFLLFEVFDLMSKAEGPGLGSETVPVPNDVFAFSATNILLQKHSSKPTYINFFKTMMCPCLLSFLLFHRLGKI